MSDIKRYIDAHNAEQGMAHQAQLLADLAGFAVRANAHRAELIREYLALEEKVKQDGQGRPV